MTNAIDPEYGLWLVLTTHPHCEARAIENLRRQGFPAYCPMVLRRIRHARHAYDAPRPLFPGYIFVEQENIAQRWRPLASTLGVRSLVMSCEMPARLPGGFIEGLKAREVDGTICKPEIPFKVGQQVTIQGGAFDGLIGQIIEMKEHDRLLVLLQFLNRQTRVQIGTMQIRAGLPADSEKAENIL